MYAISSYNNDMKCIMTVIKNEGDKIDIIDHRCDYICTNYKPYDLVITNTNILYHATLNNLSYEFIGKQLKKIEGIIKEKLNVNDIPLNLSEYGECKNRCCMGDYEMLFMCEKHVSTEYGFNDVSRILILDVNKMSMIKKIFIDSYSHFNCSSYYQNNIMYVSLCVKYNAVHRIYSETGYCQVYTIDINGNFNEFKVHVHDILNKINYDYQKNYTLVSHENLIMYYDENYKFVIFDYVNDKIIISTTFKKIDHPYSFVKLKENKIKEMEENDDETDDYSIINDFYINKKNADIEIETNDGIVLAHKLFLISSCEYFKKMLSWNHKEGNKIKLNFEKDIVDIVLKYIYKNEFDCTSVNKLLEIYYLCDEICYEKLKNHIGNILFKEHMLDENMKTIKLYNTESLNEIPDSINTIIFDKNFNKSIDNLIPFGIKKIVFGMKFNKRIVNLPDTVKELEFGLNWNMYLSDIPDHIESISLSEKYSNMITEYPKKLISINLYKSYVYKNKIPNKIIVNFIGDD